MLKIRLISTIALTVVLMPLTANAQVTADDVWQNQQDYINTLGGDFTASVAREGNMLTVSDSSLTYQLPFEFGSLVFTFSGFSLTENGDGSVGITYARPITYGLAVDIPEEGSLSAKFDVTTEGLVTTASGTPGDVTYDWTARRMDIQGRDIELNLTEPAEEGPEFRNITLQGSFSDLSGSYRIKVADMLSLDSEYTFGRQAMSFDLESDEGNFRYRSDVDSATITSQLSLPRNGFDLLNLAAALRDGMTLSTTSQIIGSQTSQITVEGDRVISSQSSRAQEQIMRFDLDQTSLRWSGSARDTEVEMQINEGIQFLIRAQIEKVRGGMTLPLSASPELQDLAFDFALEGLKLNEEIWAEIDPQQILPRDPMVVGIDLEAKVRNDLDWLDFATVKERLDNGDVPVELHELNLNGLTLDVAGARLTGTGAGTFDNSDMDSFNGLARPTGVVDLALRGGNALLDNLVIIGLLSQDDATGARLAVAAFTRPDPDAGEDALKSRLEITEDGQILANGQRLR